MKIYDVIVPIEIYTSNEEKDLLKKLKTPVKLCSLPEREQQVAENLIRKDLLQKIGDIDPFVKANEY